MHPIFINYTTNTLDDPTYTSFNFNDIDLCALGGTYAPYFAPNFHVDDMVGAANVTTHLILDNFACPEVFNDWMDIGEICFQQHNLFQTTTISFDTTYTLINKNDNYPAHIPGTFSPLTLTLDCLSCNDTPVALCQNASVALDTNGIAAIALTDIDAGSSDNCYLSDLSLSPSSFTCAEVGTNSITLTATNIVGNLASCTATVMVADTELLVARCQDISVPILETNNIIINAVDIDNGSATSCGIDQLSVSPDSFACEDVGSHTVTLTAMDNNGNEDTCTATVTVIDDFAPTAVCQDITIDLSAMGAALIAAAQIDNGSEDNCGIVTTNVVPNTFNCVDTRGVVVALTVEDAAGHTATCTANVAINDHDLPAAICQDVAVTLDATGNVFIPVAAVNNGSADNCGIANLTLMPNVFDCATLGANVVNLSITDVNSNTNNCTATVTVSDDIPPTVTCQDLNISLDETGNTTIAPTAINNSSNDNCNLSLSLSQTTFTDLDLGANTVILTATDLTGNTATCSAIVTVENPSVGVQLRVLLQGPYAGDGLMTTALATSNLLPLIQPYKNAPWHYTGTETVSSMPSNITDWILIALCDEDNDAPPFATRAALLRNDGVVLDIDGSEIITFAASSGITAGNYFILVRSRNHLDIVSASTIVLPNAVSYDFTTAATQAMGSNQQVDLGDGNFALASGDINGDGVITITDYNQYATQTSLLNMYLATDLNMDKTVSVLDFNIYQLNASLIGVLKIRS